MANTHAVQTELFEVTELPGRPMLHWHGKRPLREIPYYPAQLRERYGTVVSPPLAGEPALSEAEGGPGEGSWVNRLYWGDNLQVMAHLMREFRGKVKLIYIDPPFDSGADYRKRIRLRGHQQVLSDLGVLEERQYTDIWSNDLYLQYMYERLILMRELLAEDGSLCLHCDRRAVHRLRLILDEVFGAGNFVNEIVWKHTVLGGAHGRALPKAHETILWYAKTQGYQFNADDKAARVPFGDYIEKTLRQDEEGRWYYTRGRMSRQPSPEEEARGAFTVTYVDDPDHGTLVSDVWDDMPAYRVYGDEDESYPTQKNESLIRRLVGLASREGDLVADFFIGSGTTAAVAQKLGRRWIGADINLGAIHTTAQRLARIVEAQQKEPHQLELPSDTPSASDDSPFAIRYSLFEVYNVNHYEIFKNAEEARDIVLALYGVEPLKGHRFFDGVLDGRWVKVVDLNRICSKLDIQTIFDNLPPDDTRGVVVLCAGHEYDVPETIKQRNLLNIPFEVRDILTDRKDVIFKRPPEAQVSLARADGRITLTVEQFYSPLLLQKLSLEDDPEAIEDWRQVVASVLVDPAYDGEVFHPRISDTPARRDEMVRGEYTWEAEEYGEGQVAVKIVDVLDEEWFEVIELAPLAHDSKYLSI